MAEETKTPEENTKREISPEQKEALDALNQKIDAAIHDFVVDIYRRIDTKTLFESLGQPDKTDAFAEYMKTVEERLKTFEEEKKKSEELGIHLSDESTKIEIRPWWDFLDEKPVNAKMLGLIWDNIINSIVRISIQASQTTTNTVYDYVVAPQFANTQTNLESFAHGIGELARKVDDLEKK